MQNNIREMINNHLYPSLYFKYPLLIKLHHLTTFLTTLRNWYVKYILSRLLKASGNSFVLYDAGCGAGDFILPLMKKYKESSFIGVDRLPGNINLCNSYLNNNNLVNGKFLQEDIETYILPEKADIILCITVLQYCSNDKDVLRNFLNSLKPGGTLLLYVPVNYKRILGLSQKLADLSKHFDYDTNLGIKRHNTPQEIREIVISAGFSISDEITTYKTAGKISFELFTGLLNSIKAFPRYTYLITFPLLVFLYPIILLFMILDLIDPGKDGNGILIKALKKR